MGTFRGIGDDALTVIERQRQASQRSAQLGEQRRSNMAGEAIARERIDLAQQQAESSAVTEERKLGVEQDRNAIYRQQADTATVNAKTSQVNASREAMLAKQVYDKNEQVFQQTKKTWEAEEAQRAQAQKLAQTAFSGVIRAAAFSPGGAPQTFVTAYNMSIGVADGAPKSMLRALTIKDPKTGMAQAIGYETVGDDGKPVRNLVLPEQFWAAIEGVYGGETAKTLFGEYSKRYAENSPMYAAGAKRVGAFDVAREKALTAEQTRLEGAVTVAKGSKTALKADVAEMEAKIAKIAKIREGMLGLEAPADGYQHKRVPTERRYTPEESQSLAPGTIYTGTDGRKYKR